MAELQQNILIRIRGAATFYSLIEKTTIHVSLEEFLLKYRFHFVGIFIPKNKGEKINITI